jgi:hypothetical protein
MEEMKWTNCGFLGVLTTMNLGFCLALAEICQTFGQQQRQEGMVSPNLASQSLLNMATSLIGPIWRK